MPWNDLPAHRSGDRFSGGRSAWRPLVWRALAFLTVFAIGWAGLLSGVRVTERDLDAVGVAASAYYALGLFVMGGLDVGTPFGGPAWGRALLWTAYFAAPLITASALIEAAVRLVGPLALKVRRLRDHVVVGGAGRLAVLYVRQLRRRDPRRMVVVVERSPNHAALSELRDVHRAVVVTGDITDDGLLQRIRVDRARRALFLTGDDFANLDAAAKALRLAPELGGRIVVHVSDLGFMRETADSSVARGSQIFNGHEFAATHLVQEHLLARFHATPERDLVVLAGFGRFGQTVLHQLQVHALGSFDEVLIIDEDASKNARSFEEEPGFADDYTRSIIDGDILDPDIWERVGAKVRASGPPPVVILGSGVDGTNLHAAMLVRKQHSDAFVIIRSFRASPFTEEVARENGVHAFNLAGLIQEGMPESWF